MDALLGDISHSVYLWHFPIQLGFVLIANKADMASGFFGTGLSVLVYFCTLIIVSYFSYHLLERPAQKYLRRTWMSATMGRP